jgi:hypothetical protein
MMPATWTCPWSLGREEPERYLATSTHVQTLATTAHYDCNFEIQSAELRSHSDTLSQIVSGKGMGACVSTLETIVSIGAEGGAVALFGFRDPHRGWRFTRGVRDQTPMLLDDDDERGYPEIDQYCTWVKTWPEAMALLDRYPWAMLSGLEVHPEFRERIWIEVKYRLHGLDDRRAEDRRQRWAGLCMKVAPQTSATA